MNENPLNILKELDRKFYDDVTEKGKAVFSDGSLTKKVKLLIALALDASHGAVNGVRSLAIQAKEVGASKEEIIEAIRVVDYISGVGSTYTASAGLRDLF